MPTVVPSFVAKVARAKEHLVELEDEISTYKDSRPCTVSQLIDDKGKRKFWRLEFTADPANTDIPIVAADVIYNLRSSLDHLMAALVRPKRRSSVMFPVFWEGVWEPPVPGENAQRVKDRNRWISCVKELPDEAIAVLKSLQPPDSGGHVDETHLLALVNSLSNRDRHEKLPVAALGLRSLTATWIAPDGKAMQGTGKIAPNAMFKDQAEIRSIPKLAVDVEIEGVPAVVLKIGREDGYIEIPEQLDAARDLIELRIIPALLPHLWS
jgi:hypothetical protein